MRTAIHRLSLILDKISFVITGTIMTALCAIIVYSVIMRFCFNSPVAWQYELTLVGLCWCVFVGMPMTFHKQEHLRLTFVTRSLSPGVWVKYMNAIDVLLMIFLAAGFVCSLSIISTTWGTFYRTIPIRRGIYYVCFPIGCAFSIIHLIDIILSRSAADAPTAQRS